MATVLRMVRMWPLLVVSGFILVGTAGTNADVDRADVPVALLCAVVVVAMIGVAMRHPAPALVACGAVLLVYHVAALADGPIFLGLPAVAFVAGGADARRRTVYALATGIALALAGLTLKAAVHDVSVAGSVWQALAMTGLAAAAFLVGGRVAARTQLRRERARRVAGEERLRLAGELHDSVGHGLAVIAVQAGVGLRLLDRDPDAARGALEAIREASTASLDALRAQISALTGDEAPRAPAPGLADLPALVTRVEEAGLDVDLSLPATEVDPATGVVVHAVVQEALTNVLRHADAARVRVDVGADDHRVLLVVADDGRGPVSPAPAAPGGGGMGLAGMRRRVEQAGGSLAAGAAPGGGFEVRAVLPRGEAT
ncbi:MAG: sensor histidine kinase [Thermoleophilia bacterium]|nr:sensor histidine kinase [Thermoleophilia bacterium]